MQRLGMQRLGTGPSRCLPWFVSFGGVGLDDDLRAYYDAEARAGRRGVRDEMRHQLRRRFAAILRSEDRRRLIEVGAGPGIEAADWVADGHDVVAVDLGVENCRVAATHGVSAVAASLSELPVRDARFDALWTMSTFVHVPHDRKHDALDELVRVVEPGAPLGVGTWGGRDFEGHPEFGDLRPYRFFSLMEHDDWRATLAAHGELESFETFAPRDDSGWEYQFAVLRVPGGTTD
jgi:SAM-dependent methyltransferase